MMFLRSLIIQNQKLFLLLKAQNRAELVNDNNYLIFKDFDVWKKGIENWVSDEDLSTTHFQDFIKILKNFTVVNDGAEWNIKLIPDFINATRNENLLNVLFVTWKNQRVLSKSMTKEELNNC